MQQGEKATRKWVDYSDDSEEQPNSDDDRPNKPTGRPQHSSSSPNCPVDHRSQQFIQEQLARYDRARQNSQEIWLLLESEDSQLLDRKIRDLKDNGNKDVINIYMSKDTKGAWDIRIKESAVTSWVKDGIDRLKNIKITVADRNFPRERGDRNRDRGDRGDRGDRRGRGRDRGERGQRGERGERGERGGRRGGGRDRDRDGRRNRDGGGQPQKKKVYVDKVTGQAPSNKQECQQKVLVEKERHYTRQEAEKVGEGLGNFRNKPKVEPKVEMAPENNVIKPESRQYFRSDGPRVKEEGKAWTRKDREELRQEQQRGHVEVNERKGEGQQVKEKRPDVQQVRQGRDKKIEYREKQPSELAITQESKASQLLADKKKQKKVYVRIDNLTQEEKLKLKQKPPQREPQKEREKEREKEKEKDFLSEDSN